MPSSCAGPCSSAARYGLHTVAGVLRWLVPSRSTKCWRERGWSARTHRTEPARRCLRRRRDLRQSSSWHWRLQNIGQLKAPRRRQSRHAAEPQRTIRTLPMSGHNSESCTRLSVPSPMQAKKLEKSIAKAEKKEKKKKERKQHRRSSSSEDAAAPGVPTSGNHVEEFSKASPARVAQRNDRSGAGDRQREDEPYRRHAVDDRARRPDRGDPANDLDRQRQRIDGRSSRRRDASPSWHDSDRRRRRSRSPTSDRQHRR